MFAYSENTDEKYIFKLIIAVSGCYKIYFALKLYVNPTLTPASNMRKGYFSDEIEIKACILA